MTQAKAAHDDVDVRGEYDHLKDDLAALRDGVAALTAALAADGKGRVLKLKDDVVESSERVVAGAEKKIKARPLMAVLIAFLVGIVLSRLFLGKR